ncbi:AB hydrolase-1 domain-containing protein [Mycena chlorophos]|uniref:AB hydrolase-1 domain-containing protein n=1 Tax=Mycena chlorophos TaxID=658473 RepID=A0A8H6S8R7_MYCCL|nr:AB hydrolase-1 domain-containing protein [Mycena chlorophos]
MAAASDERSIGLFTEQTLELPNGIRILYLDSGAPATDDYTTLISFHGTGLNSYGFTKMLAYAHPNNVRLILCNRRDYRGSTPYTDAELAELYAGEQSFQDRLGIELAHVLAHFVRKSDVRPVSEDRTTGGMVLMGWSSGNNTTLALLGSASVIPKEVYDEIEPYLRELVMYDASCMALGIPRPAGDNHPSTSLTGTTREAAFAKFLAWVSAFYPHPDIASGSPSGLCFAEPGERQTAKLWTNAEMELFCDMDAGIRSWAPDPGPMQATLSTQTHKALFDPELTTRYFPMLTVLYIAGDQTPSSEIWAYIELRRLYRALEDSGMSASARPMRFVLVPGGNHFLHYEMPERFLKDIVSGCMPAM